MHVLLQRGRARAGAEWIRVPRIRKRTPSRFNGAAPARARNATENCVAMARNACRFNGAAPARARNGRAAQRIGSSPYASTGPRPRGRGMRVPSVQPQGRVSGFNGAAPARARNDRPENLGLQPGLLLQRGRARAGAECWLNGVPYVTCQTDASTGPRPRGRGMFHEIPPSIRRAVIASTGPRPRGRGMVVIK